MTIRPVPETTLQHGRIRLEPLAEDPTIRTVHRDQASPVAVGTVVLMAFRVDALHQDPDGSLLASVSRVDAAGRATGPTERRVTLCSGDAWTVDDPRELTRLGSEVLA